MEDVVVDDDVDDEERARERARARVNRQARRPQLFPDHRTEGGRPGLSEVRAEGGEEAESNKQHAAVTSPPSLPSPSK